MPEISQVHLGADTLVLGCAGERILLQWQECSALSGTLLLLQVPCQAGEGVRADGSVLRKGPVTQGWILALGCIALKYFR